MQSLNEILIQGSSAWLEHRKKCVTGTDAAIICGVSPFKNVRQLFDEKLGKTPYGPINDAMRRGTEQEPIARKWLENELKMSFAPDVKFHIQYPWMMASLDGINLDDDIICEIKCSKKCYEKASQGIIDIYYLYQVYHQLIVSNAKFCWFCAYHEGKGWKIRINLSENAMDEILEKELEFYECLIKGEPHANWPLTY